MTREEAKDKITELAKENFWGCGECLEALEMAIKALEQEPCNDCISRKSVEELISNNNDKYGYSDRFHEFTEECMKLPPVQPKQESVIHSKWERGYSFPDGAYWKCLHCNELIKVKIPMHYCNNCGAKMDKE